MSKKKRKKPSIQRLVEQAIVKKKTFSIHMENPQGFKLIAEIITYYLLKDTDERTRLMMFAQLLPKVKNALPNAIVSLEKQGFAVRRGAKPGNGGGGRLWWLTLTDDYRHAVERDTDRTIKQLRSVVTSKARHLRLSNPSAIPEITRVTQKLLTGST